MAPVFDNQLMLDKLGVVSSDARFPVDILTVYPDLFLVPGGYSHELQISFHRISGNVFIIEYFWLQRTVSLSVFVTSLPALRVLRFLFLVKMFAYF